MIVGVDEAGRGPLAGPVVGCALYLQDDAFCKELKDSKKLTPAKREELFHWLMRSSIFSIGCVSHRDIDKYNILEATMICFNRAIQGLLDKAAFLKDATFIIDGNMFRTKLDIKYRCIVGADSKFREVSAASIVAKVIRDYLMHVADFLYPRWKFSQHKGYPTKQHRELIKQKGWCDFHRISFLKKIL